MFLHMNEKEKGLLRCLVINPYVSCYRLIYKSLINVRNPHFFHLCITFIRHIFQTNQNIITEQFIYKSIQMQIENFNLHPYGLTKDLIASALDALNKMKIIKKNIK